MGVRICFFAILCISVSTLLKQIRPDMLSFLRIGFAIVVSTITLGVLNPILVYVRSLLSGTSLDEIGETLLKALGIAFLSQICSDICRDCGENSAAAGVELMARLEILLLSLPMLEKVISTAREVLSL